MIIERSIGLLKDRLRELKGIADVDRTRFLPKLITAACTLHNCCIYSHDEIEYFLDPDDDDGDAND